MARNNLRVAGFEDFADHHRYTEDDIERLLNNAGQHRLITTEKDIVKIPEFYRPKIDVLKISLRFENPENIVSLLKTLSS